MLRSRSRKLKSKVFRGIKRRDTSLVAFDRIAVLEVRATPYNQRQLSWVVFPAPTLRIGANTVNDTRGSNTIGNYAIRATG